MKLKQLLRRTDIMSAIIVITKWDVTRYLGSEQRKP